MEWYYAGQQKDIAALKKRVQKTRNSIHIQGKKVSLRRAPLDGEKKKPPKRGVIKVYSPGSRRRLLDWIARVAWDELPKGMFITLTYPDEVADADFDRTTDQRNAFIQKMERHLRKPLPHIWRKEQQPRKSGVYQKICVQHYHLCVFATDWIWCAQINQWWKECIKWQWNVQTHRMFMAGQHAAFYMAKYLSQTDEQKGILEDVSYLNKPGRAWGIRRKELVTMAPRDDYVGITDEQYELIMSQLLCLCPKAVQFGLESFSLLGRTAEEAKAIIYEIMH